MASIFLSPSVQEYNKYLTGGDEEQYMNLIADAMMPYLEASGIYVTNLCPQPSPLPMREFTICTWRCTPTHLQNLSPASYRGPTYTITATAFADRKRRQSSPII